MWNLVPNQTMQPTRLAGRDEQPRRVYKVRPRKDDCGIDLISDALPYGAL
jgi:hypothetical protein